MFENYKKWSKAWDKKMTERNLRWWGEIRRVDEQTKSGMSATSFVVGLFGVYAMSVTLAVVGAIQMWGPVAWAPQSLFAFGIAGTFLFFALDVISIWYMRHRYNAELGYLF